MRQLVPTQSWTAPPKFLYNEWLNVLIEGHSSCYRLTSSMQGYDKFFAQVPTDTAVHYIDHQRRRRAVQRVASHLGVAEGEHLYQFNGSDFLKIDSVRLAPLDTSTVEWSLYRNTFYHPDRWGDSARLVTFETDLLYFRNLSSAILTQLQRMKDLQYVMDANNKPVKSEVGQPLIGLVVAARYISYRLDPLSGQYTHSYSTTYSSLQSIERMDGSPPVRETQDTSGYQLVPFASFFD